MTVYARSDVASVTISPAHGGCGAVHTRPAPGGEPVRVFALTCAACEDVLRYDSLWGASATAIPETPDEVINREANEKRTSVEQAARNVEAMEKLGAMPETLAKVLADLIQGKTTLPMAMCPAGHPAPGSSAFCGECGARMARDAPPVAAEALPEPPLTEEPQDAPEGFLKASEPEDAVDLESLSLGELKKLATSYGVPTRRSKEDQISALRDYLEQ